MSTQRTDDWKKQGYILVQREIKKQEPIALCWTGPVRLGLSLIIKTGYVLISENVSIKCKQKLMGSSISLLEMHSRFIGIYFQFFILIRVTCEHEEFSKKQNQIK